MKKPVVKSVEVEYMIIGGSFEIEGENITVGISRPDYSDSQYFRTTIGFISKQKFGVATLGDALCKARNLFEAGVISKEDFVRVL